MSLPLRLLPQLCQSAKQAPEGIEWCHEIKHDGFRLLCRKEGAGVRLFTRNGHDWTRRLEHVARAAASISAESAWLDGELVFYGEDGRTDFGALQKHLSFRGGSRLTFQIWDLIYLDGASLAEVALIERKEMLAARLVGADPCIRFTDHIVGQGPAVFSRADKMELEGVVSKRVDSRYRPGARTPDWLKVKVWREYDLVLVGVEVGRREERAESLLMARWGEDGGRLEYAGRVNIAVPRMDEMIPMLRTLGVRAPFEFAKTDRVLWLPEPVPARVKDIPLRPGEMLRHATLIGGAHP